LFESAGYPFPPYADRCLAELQPYLSRPEEPASERERTHGAPANREEPLALVVPLCAREAKLGVVTFYRFGGDFDEADTRTAVDLVSRAAVCIDNARRYTREHSVAQSLQHDLLPSRFPRQSAVEVAQSLVTADGGTEWFDVVPVSSARVALVVGSLKGRGLYAAGAMGRLRTAVHALAGLDLGPDEVLGRLDGLVTRITAEREHEGAAGCPDGAVVGATCLYAVYDPASGRLTLASAGHPAPVVVDPDGNTHPIDIPAGAALGTSDDPFGMVDVDVPPGSTLALYTPGLVSGEGTGEPASFLADLVSRPDVPLHDLCREVVATLLPGEYRQDALLLLARTHLLREDQFVSWDLPSDPAIVGTARSLVARQLAAWNLEEATFSTQLIASELVTNSIRYAEGPIELRLLRDRALICEVSDGSTTAPHLRFAGTGDEGGRGLFMTAELTHQWGTRFGEHGKTIWTEQPLPGEG
jgi:anti-sigma regulatory factor (Ser/Thr protein kinase)